MTTNSANLREYANSARRAYYAVCNAHVIDLDMYRVERRTYLAEYKLAVTEAYELARAEGWREGSSSILAFAFASVAHDILDGDVFR